MTPLRQLLCLVACLALCACANLGNARLPLPVFSKPAPAPAASRPLVIMLPGRWDDLQGLQASGIAEAIQAGWPEAEVRLVEARLAYYRDGQLAERLHREVIAPARQAGYGPIWVSGASMGGLGTLLYAQAHPDAWEGIVLLAPYMGSNGLIKEIARAGGAGLWDPGPEPAGINRSNYQREIWRFVKSWPLRSQQGQQIWIAAGRDDRLARALPLLDGLLPEHRRSLPEGGHKWTVWTPEAQRIFTSIANDWRRKIAQDGSAKPVASTR